jgi:hypothetical protein
MIDRKMRESPCEGLVVYPEGSFLHLNNLFLLHCFCVVSFMSLIEECTFKAVEHDWVGETVRCRGRSLIFFFGGGGESIGGGACMCLGRTCQNYGGGIVIRATLWTGYVWGKHVTNHGVCVGYVWRALQKGDFMDGGAVMCGANMSEFIKEGRLQCMGQGVWIYKVVGKGSQCMGQGVWIHKVVGKGSQCMGKGFLDTQGGWQGFTVHGGGFYGYTRSLARVHSAWGRVFWIHRVAGKGFAVYGGGFSRCTRELPRDTTLDRALESSKYRMQLTVGHTTGKGLQRMGKGFLGTQGRWQGSQTWTWVFERN